jgi:Cdc6-like AAA superfamily ATPase
MLYLIRGLPGSGKTTLADDIARTYGGKHYEADMYFIGNDGEYRWDSRKIREAHEWCQYSTCNALENDNVVVVYNTFTTKKELAPYFEMALARGITPVVYHCQNNWGNVHNVPPNTLEAMAKRFEYNLDSLFEKHENDLKRRT